MNTIIRIASEMVSFYNELAIYLILGILIAGILYVIIPESFIRRHLGDRSFLSVLKSTAIGIPLPLCSCGVIPVAASLNRSGASKGAVSAFLVSTPQVGPDSYLITYSLFGWVFALFRVVAALIASLATGIAFTLMERNDKKVKIAEDSLDAPEERWTSRLRSLPSYLEYNVLGAIANSLLLGILLAGLISALLPETLFTQYLSGTFSSMLFMLIISIPLYVCASASTPIAASLVMKGVSPGAALVFLLVGPATNTVTLTAVTKMMGKKGAVVYLLVVAVASLSLGFLLDALAIQPALSHAIHAHHHEEMMPKALTLLGSIGLSAMLILFYVKTKIIMPLQKRRRSLMQNERIALDVKGMTCMHCAGNVKKAVGLVQGTSEINVDLASGKVEFILEQKDRLQEIKTAIQKAGYDL